MADYPVWDEIKGVYNLFPIMTCNERAIGQNPSFELAYWQWGLKQAQIWRKRLNLPFEVHWDNVCSKLNSLPMHDNLYITIEGWEDNYNNPEKTRQHPDPVGICAFIPPVKGVDSDKAAQTVKKIWDIWDWSDTWGWDFPWIAMAAARTGQPEIAIEALLKDASPNRYDVAGVNNGWYLPGNGGLLYAVAMMAAGWDGCQERNAPGFPSNGLWDVKWEGLKKSI